MANFIILAVSQETVLSNMQVLQPVNKVDSDYFEWKVTRSEFINCRVIVEIDTEI